MVTNCICYYEMYLKEKKKKKGEKTDKGEKEKE